MLLSLVVIIQLKEVRDLLQVIEFLEEDSRDINNKKKVKKKTNTVFKNTDKPHMETICKGEPKSQLVLSSLI